MANVCYSKIKFIFSALIAFLDVQWNLVIKRSDITKRSYNKKMKVILLVPALSISLFLP